MAQNSGIEPMTAEATLRGGWVPCNTVAAPDASLGNAPARDSYEWSDVGDLLLKWLSDPLMLEDDGIDAPTRELIKSAIDFFHDFADKLPPPTSVAPTQDGEISFEWRRANVLEIVEIVSVGVAEHTVISGNSVSSHATWHRTPPTRQWEQVAQ